MAIKPIQILGVSGSMGEKSYSVIALQVALEAAAEYGAQTHLLDLRTVDLPIMRPDLKEKSSIIQEIHDAVRWADAFILASPDYHGGMSGALKNFLDYHWREFSGKLFGYVCASHDKGLTAMDQMRVAVRQCYGWSLPYGVAIHSKQDFNANVELTNEVTKQRLRLVGRDMTIYGGLLRDQYAKDLAAGEKETFARGE